MSHEDSYDATGVAAKKLHREDVFGNKKWNRSPRINVRLNGKPRSAYSSSAMRGTFGLTAVRSRHPLRLPGSG